MSLLETINKKTKNHTKIQKVSHINFDFDTDSFKEMKELTKETRSTGIEKGGMLCRNFDKNKIFLRNKCSGTDCEVTITGKSACKENEFPIGSFHTHPKGKYHNINLSIKDMKRFIEAEQFSCIGTSSIKSDKITCYSRSSIFDEYKNEESKFNKMLDIEAEIHEQKIRKEISKMSDKKFDEFVKKYDKVIKYTNHFNKHLKKVELI